MRFNIKSLGLGSRRRVILSALVITAAFGLFLWPTANLSGENFVFYLPNQSRVVPLQTIDSAPYLPVLEVLNLAGKVQGWEEKGKQLHIYFEANELRLQINDRKVKIDKMTRQLSRPVAVENGQWMVPIEFLDVVLPVVSRQQIDYHSGSKRAFIGGVRSNSFVARLEPEPAGAKLVFSFAAPVTLRTASSNGKYILFLGAHPVQPPQSTFGFQNPYATGLQFDDSDGLPKLILTPGGSGLDFYATLAAGGKTVVAELKKPAAPPPPVQQTQTAPAASTAAPAPPQHAPAPAPALPSVVLDAGHGGADTGARAKNGMQEKDFVSQLVEQVSAGLAATKKYQVVLTRPGDASPGPDDRDATANRARPIAFVSFHAGNLGPAGAKSPRLMIYTYQNPASDQMQGGEARQTLFRRWDDLQMAHLASSRALGEAMKARLSGISGVAVAGPSPAPVRVLRSVNAPAVAIEVGTLSPDVDPAPLTDPSFQQQFATAVVQAIQGQGIQ